jgi:hypothetical protein
MRKLGEFINFWSVKLCDNLAIYFEMLPARLDHSKLELNKVILVLRNTSKVGVASLKFELRFDSKARSAAAVLAREILSSNSCQLVQ